MLAGTGLKRNKAVEEGSVKEIWHEDKDHAEGPYALMSEPSGALLLARPATEGSELERGVSQQLCTATAAGCD